MELSSLWWLLHGCNHTQATQTHQSQMLCAPMLQHTASRAASHCYQILALVKGQVLLARVRQREKQMVCSSKGRGMLHKNQASSSKQRTPLSPELLTIRGESKLLIPNPNIGESAKWAKTGFWDRVEYLKHSTKAWPISKGGKLCSLLRLQTNFVIRVKIFSLIDIFLIGHP